MHLQVYSDIGCLSYLRHWLHVCLVGKNYVCQLQLQHDG